MEYVLKVLKNGDKHIVTDEDLDREISPGVTLREAVRVDLDDSLGWKKCGYHPEMIRKKLIFKYQSEAINAEAIS